jgi:hypothetical protein
MKIEYPVAKVADIKVVAGGIYTEGSGGKARVVVLHDSTRYSVYTCNDGRIVFGPASSESVRDFMVDYKYTYHPDAKLVL